MDRPLKEWMSETLEHYKGSTTEFENASSYRVDIPDVYVRLTFRSRPYLASRIFELRQFIATLDIMDSQYFFTSMPGVISVHFYCETHAILFKLSL